MDDMVRDVAKAFPEVSLSGKRKATGDAARGCVLINYGKVEVNSRCIVGEHR
jgi:hypothetical protein